jgi:disulfide bond formation protein DsbB
MIQTEFVHDEGFCQEGVSCSVRWVNYWGFVTIPFMAQVAFVLISVIMIATVLAARYVHFDED